MTLHELFEAIQNLPFAVAIAESDKLFPTIEVIHVIALTMVVGTIAILDLRLLQVTGQDLSVMQVTKDVLPWTWGAFALAAISGALMFSSKAVFYSESLPFRAKMLLMALAGLNMLLFHNTTYRTVAEWQGYPRLPSLARLAGTLSLLFWIGVVTFGRWVGFVDIQ